jgi:hypothetical protein
MLRAVSAAIRAGLREQPWHTLADSVALAELLDRITAATHPAVHRNGMP